MPISKAEKRRRKRIRERTRERHRGRPGEAARRAIERRGGAQALRPKQLRRIRQRARRRSKERQQRRAQRRIQSPTGPGAQLGAGPAPGPEIPLPPGGPEIGPSEDPPFAPGPGAPGGPQDQPPGTGVPGGPGIPGLPTIGGFNVGEQGPVGIDDPLSAAIANRLGTIISAEGSPQFGVPAVGEAGAAGLRGQIETGGLDPGLLAAARASLQEQLEGARSSAVERLEEELAGRRLTGGGTERSRRTSLDVALQEQIGTRLRELQTNLGIGAASRQLAASQSAFGGGIQLRGQNIDQFQDFLRQQIAATGVATDRALGVAGVMLAQLAESRAFANMLFQNRLLLAQFIEGTRLARQGQVSNLLGFLLNIGQLLAGGFVE